MIASGGVSKTNNILQQFVDETEIERLIREEENSNSVNATGNAASENKNGQSTFSTFAKLIAPGVIVPGTITLTGSDLYFDADEDDQSFKQNLQSLQYCDNLHHSRWNFQEIRAIFLRRFLLQYTSLELFLDSRTAIMFAFPRHGNCSTCCFFIASCWCWS
uniref:BEACH-type PH domain-containing protein n=1 Tax=Meloidogyne enterolobii TaxID=390850 RepID=A0A6V7TWN2_MELEN|nr:unnamed protein product [Meloidogyne enterolobii]